MPSPGAHGYEIRPLTGGDAANIAALMRAQPPAYSRMFYAFGSDEAEIEAMIAGSRRDVYLGMFWNDALLSVAMLRGWDSGYDIPSIGMIVDNGFKGRQVMRVFLDVAKLVCRLAGAKVMMAKIHPDNVSVRGAIRLGFRHIGSEPETGNNIYHMDL